MNDRAERRLVKQTHEAGLKRGRVGLAYRRDTKEYRRFSLYKHLGRTGISLTAFRARLPAQAGTQFKELKRYFASPASVMFERFYPSVTEVHISLASWASFSVRNRYQPRGFRTTLVRFITCLAN
jgi:hypothetical protein